MQTIEDGQHLSWLRPRYRDKGDAEPSLHWLGMDITWRQSKANPGERRGSATHPLPTALVVESIGATPWSVTLDCIKGYPRLMMFPPRIASQAGHLFVLTEGEDHAGASHHNHKIHCISGAGEHCWTLSREVLPQVYRVDGGWLLLSFTEAPGYRRPERLWELVHVSKEGSVRENWFIDAPPDVQENAELVPRKTAGFVIQTKPMPGKFPDSDASRIKVADGLFPLD